MADVKMQDTATPEATKPQDAKTQDPNVLILNDVVTAIELVEKAVSSKEGRWMTRALRQATQLRKKISLELLHLIVDSSFPDNHTSKAQLLGILSKDVMMATDELSSVLPKRSASLPEVEMFLSLLVIMALVDAKDAKRAEECSGILAKRLQSFNRRMMDPIAARVWFFISLIFERSKRLVELRDSILAAYRTACLHHNEVGQAMFINLLLRNYTQHRQFDLADKLISKTQFPESASNYQHSRYDYYVGLVRSVQLEYTEAFTCLSQSLRKAPQHGALGFRLEVNRLLCVVHLLMGEIPPRDMFYQQDLARALSPYLQLTHAVRGGNLHVFEQEMAKYRDLFVRDRTYHLIVRLRQNVIKTALRNISLAYSSISLKDVSEKLGVPDVQDAEYIVAKAIADGVIDARLNHEDATMRSTDNLDLYSTQEPQAAFHKRIEFCLKVRNEAVRAMRYPEDAHNKDPETPDERRSRLAAEAELAEALQDEEHDDF
eukprot:c33373_g1_i1.p1 GENE.c33373_g1_i1~~c33373_g1_i1.p1  ORF type:complete len:507 (+),score=129.96 c33373_g1_i1:56-1522(+)